MLEKLSDKIKKESIILYILSLIVYLPFMVHQLNNADGVSNGLLYHSDNYVWEDAQGRFFIKYFDMWRDGMISPSLIVALSLFFMVCIVVLVWRIFDCNNLIEKYLIGICILFSPSVANLLTYYYCADSYCFAYLLAIVAVACLLQNGKKYFVAAVVMLVISMGIYQTYIGAAVSVCTVWIIREILKNELDARELLKKVARMVCGIGISAGGYLVLFKVLEKVGYLYPTGTRGMNNIVGNLIEKSAGLIQLAYTAFWDYFFTGNLINNYWRGRRYFNALILVGTLLLIGYLWEKKKIYKSVVKTLLLIVAVIIFPIMLTLIVIVAPDASVYAETGILMLAYMNYMYILPLVLLEEIGVQKWQEWIKYSFRILVAGIGIILIIFVQVFARSISLEQSKMQNLAYQIETRLENLEDYKPYMKVLVIGRPQNGNYPIVDGDIADITKGMISQYSLIFASEDHISNGWVKLLKYYCGTNYNSCDAEQRERIINSSETEKMGLFPHSTSIKKIEDVIVIRFS